MKDGTRSGSGVVCAGLLALIESWKHRARMKFEDAKHEKDIVGRRHIEHGAMCYFNAAMELEALVSKPPHVSSNQAIEKTSKKP